jgi:ribA/ribD-fused uncharacterized protein
MKKEINDFSGENKFLSNFYLHPLAYDGLIYPAVENAFQAQKTMDADIRLTFRGMKPERAKQRGRQLDLRPDWEFLKDDLMLELLQIKFRDGELARKLLATGNANLVEGNWWGDEYWGRCNGKGLNKLGVLLMQVRSALNQKGE